MQKINMYTMYTPRPCGSIFENTENSLSRDICVFFVAVVSDNMQLYFVGILVCEPGAGF